MTQNTKYLWHCAVAENALQDGNRSSNDDIVTDVLHDSGCFSGHKCQQHWCLVQVPEQEQLATTCRCAAHVAKQVGVWIPENPIKAEHNLTFQYHLVTAVLAEIE